MEENTFSPMLIRIRYQLNSKFQTLCQQNIQDAYCVARASIWSFYCSFIRILNTRDDTFELSTCHFSRQTPFELFRFKGSFVRKKRKVLERPPYANCLPTRRTRYTVHQLLSDISFVEISEGFYWLSEVEMGRLDFVGYWIAFWQYFPGKIPSFSSTLFSCSRSLCPCCNPAIAPYLWYKKGKSSLREWYSFHLIFITYKKIRKKSFCNTLSSRFLFGSSGE